ncbi:MAG: NUDIX hydrolase [Nitrospinae bacterium]|nr:NUDIX hydrolase [Nitrospinota bacterium]
MNNKQFPSIVDKQETSISRWLTLVKRNVKFSKEEAAETYHSVRPYDYVSILAVTRDLKIPLVQQYRPSLESQSLELPGGLLDTNDTPEKTALKELREETGLVSSSIEPLGVLTPDPGRLDNRFYCFYAPNAEIDSTAITEQRIKLVWTDVDELRQMILDGRFTSCPQISLLTMASLRGHIKGF